MNILYVSYAYKIGTSGLYNDLAEALHEAGHKVTVFASVEEIKGGSNIIRQNGVKICQVLVPKRFNVHPARKAFAFFMIPGIFIREMKRHLPDEPYDFILFESPPVTMWKVVAWAKRRFGCRAFLQQKDIFPDALKDIGVLSIFHPAYWYYKMHEINSLKTADYVGYMSEGNREYIEAHNKYLAPGKLVYFPNTKKIRPVQKNSKAQTRKKYGIPEDACVFLFGGNLGYAQYVDYLCELLVKGKDNPLLYFLALGTGVFEDKVKNCILNNKIANAKCIPFLPRDEYEKLEQSVDVGISILHYKYNIPNYPSKVLGYMHAAIPVLSASDKNTDFRKLITEEAKCGLWACSDNIEPFYANALKLAENKDLRAKLGGNGRKYLEENFDVKYSVKILEGLFKK